VKYAVRAEAVDAAARLGKTSLATTWPLPRRLEKLPPMNPAPAALPQIDLKIVERGLTVPLPQAMMAATLSGMSAEVAQVATVWRRKADVKDRRRDQAEFLSAGRA